MGPAIHTNNSKYNCGVLGLHWPWVSICSWYVCVFKTHVKNLSPHVKQNNGHICCFHALMKFSHCIHPIPSQNVHAMIVWEVHWTTSSAWVQHVACPHRFQRSKFPSREIYLMAFHPDLYVYVCISLHIGGVFNLGADFLTIQNRMWKLPFNQKVWGWLRRATFRTPVGWWL